MKTPVTKVKLHELVSADLHAMDWKPTRFPESWVKVLSARDGIVFFMTRNDPGSYTFAHLHEFRQLRYIVEGEYIINGKTYGPGCVIDFPERVPYEVSCPKGGLQLLVQAPGVSTGVGPSDPRQSIAAYGAPPPRENDATQKE